MLPKEERELVTIAGRYTYYKMKDLGLTLNIESYKKYLDEKKKEQRLKKKMGTTRYMKMKELNLPYEEFIQYEKEQKLKKYETKREKDKIRQKTVRYIERYCDLEKKCQICKTKENIQIHHPNYKDYLKVNLLCGKHHNQLHNFELVPPTVIDLEEISIKKPPKKEKQDYIKQQLENMKIDVFKNEYTYQDLCKKYGITGSTIRRYFLKEDSYTELERKLKENCKRKNILKKTSNKNNPLLKYKQKYNLTSKQISKITNIPLPTIRAIETGKTKIENITEITKKKLEVLEEVK